MLNQPDVDCETHVRVKSWMDWKCYKQNRMICKCSKSKRGFVIGLKCMFLVDPGQARGSSTNTSVIFKILTKTLQKKFRIEIWCFWYQICFQNQFSTSESGQTENPQLCVFADFLFDHFLKLKIDSKSRFEMKNTIFQF